MNIDKKLLMAVFTSLFLGFVVWFFFFNERQSGQVSESCFVEYDELERIFESGAVAPVLILGSGPAGLSAGIYASRAGLKPIVLCGEQRGGQLIGASNVENWPGVKKGAGNEIMKQLEIQAKDFGVSVIEGTATSVDLKKWPLVVSLEDGSEIKALSMIISTGATPKKLDVAGEDWYWGHGVSTCAVCDAPAFKGKVVAVIGGGDSAVEEAIQLSGYAKKIFVLVRRDEMRASRHMQKQLEVHSNIEIMYNVEPTEIVGDDDGVTDIGLLDKKSGEKKSIPVGGVFLAIGHTPNTELFKGQLKLGPSGHILLSGRGQKTSVDGVFAAGDVEDPTYRQAGVSAGSGIKAASDAIAFLRNRGITAVTIENFEDDVFTKKVDPVEIREIADFDELEKEISDSSKKPLFVDFFTQICPACVRAYPSLKSVAAKHTEQMDFVKVDVGTVSGVGDKYFIKAVPTFMVFKDGKLAGRYTGLMSEDQLEKFVSEFI